MYGDSTDKWPVCVTRPATTMSCKMHFPPAAPCATQWLFVNAVASVAVAAVTSPIKTSPDVYVSRCLCLCLFVCVFSVFGLPRPSYRTSFVVSASITSTLYHLAVTPRVHRIRQGWLIDWVRLNVPPNTIIGHIGDVFYGSNDPTNSVIRQGHCSIHVVCNGESYFRPVDL